MNTKLWVYVHSKQAPYFIERCDEDGQRSSYREFDTYEHRPDAYARACALNRALGIDENFVNVFFFFVRDRKRRRKYEEQVEINRLKREEAEAARKRARDAEIARGSPGGRSPEAVDKDEAFERVAGLDGGTWPASRQHVVRHRVLGTLWSCLYTIRDDDSDYACGTSWHEVEAVVETLTVYRRKE